MSTRLSEFELLTKIKTKKKKKKNSASPPAGSKTQQLTIYIIHSKMTEK
jgi:hypothetical protein